MKLVSWNVNGLRAVMDKGFMEEFDQLDADVFCLQEIKLQAGQIDWKKEGYYDFWNYAEKKGYSGTAIFSKENPLNVTYGIGVDCHDHEGRVITLEFEKYYMITVYTPNSQTELKRLDYRMTWEEDFKKYLLDLRKNNKPVVICGDLNVAATEIDIKNPKANEKNAGYTIEERTKFKELLESGFIDSFRYLHSEEVKYSWWSYRFNARAKNAGWRLDYFLVSEDAKDKIEESDILTEIYGSDHAPVVLNIEFDS